MVESPDVVCASPRLSRRAIGRRRPIRVMESPVRITPRLTVQDQLTVVGAVVLNCHPPLLPGAMNVSGVDLAGDSVIRGRRLAEFDLSGVRCDSADRSWN